MREQGEVLFVERNRTMVVKKLTKTVKKLTPQQELDKFTKQFEKQGKKELQKLFINWLIKDIYHFVGDDDILQRRDNKMFFKGKALTNDQVKTIQEDAERFKNSQIWHFLHKELEYQAADMGFAKARGEDDMLRGKLMLLLVNIVNEKLQSLSK